MIRLLMTSCLLAVAAAAPNNHAVPVAVPVLATVDQPRYAFNYAVSDPGTRDNKAQWETRDGDAVKGSYSLVEPDGSVRVVDYAADALHGFNAVVKNLGPNLHPTTVVTHAVEPINSVITPLNYGFGAPIVVDIPKAASLGHWSLPWDPITHSYGGWVPLAAPLQPLPILPPSGPYATVFSKKYVNGKLYKWITGPIPLTGNKLIFRKKH